MRCCRAILLGGLLSAAPLAALQGTTPTFSSDVAPILFARCSGCHHPDGAAPFSLLTYGDARQRAGLIAAVTSARLMPPWKALPGEVPFVGQNRLSDDQIETLRRWAALGAPEGDPRDLPATPTRASGWQLGSPDVVVTLPEFTLPAGGTDVFRIFVASIPLRDTRFVRGLEFRPGDPRVVHHANIRIDRTPASRRLDDEDPAPGYDGLIAHSASYPDGHFLAWTPGQTAPLLPDGLAWRLDPGTDFVVELHLQPSGKPQRVQPEVGLYFGGGPPERLPAVIRLGRQNIDIPAGERAYTVTDSFTLPVDVDVHALQPHAHYRAQRVRGTAELPDGRTMRLIEIPAWDFRWQQVYRYAAPVPLPRGTTVKMQIEYDNSSANPRNPQPPVRVTWGQRSNDEMGDLWLQVLTRTEQERALLIERLRPKVLSEDIIGYEARIRQEPDSAALRDDVALLYLETGAPGRAVDHFAVSARLRPDSAAAHYNLGTALSFAGRLDEAVARYREALRLTPRYAAAHNNLGGVLLQRGELTDALRHLQAAVQIDPAFADARDNLGRALQIAGRWAEAAEQFAAAVQLRPDWARGIGSLAWLLATAPDGAVRDPIRAIELASRAVSLTGGRDAGALDVLAAAHAANGRFDEAVRVANRALRLAAEAQRSSIAARTALYESGIPYRQSAPLP